MAEEGDFNPVILRHPQGQTPKLSTFNTSQPSEIRQEEHPLYDPYHKADPEAQFDTKHEPVIYPPAGRVLESESGSRRGFAKLHDSDEARRPSAGRGPSWDVFAGMIHGRFLSCDSLENRIGVIRNQKVRTRG
jgi:hypothetical protein